MPPFAPAWIRFSLLCTRIYRIKHQTGRQRMLSALQNQTLADDSKYTIGIKCTFLFRSSKSHLIMAFI